MRGFLLFLALASPIVLANPLFWWIVGVHVGASPAIYNEADGTSRPAMLGPGATWPEWGNRPETGTLTVRARFSASPTMPATGFGDIDMGANPRRAVAEYAALLRSEGWRVELSEYKTVWPDLPPAMTALCILHATREREGGGVRTMSGRVDLQLHPGKGALHWTDGQTVRARPLGETSERACE